MARSATHTLSNSRRPEDILRLITEATSPVTGDQFFRTLMQKLATTLGVRWAFITKCLDYPTTRVRVIAFWSGDGFADNHEIELTGTPCEQVIKDGKVCFYPKGVGQVFLKARKLGRESYIGIPIFDSAGTRVIGHITIQDDKEMSDEMLIESVFRVFAARAGAELQRAQTEEALRDSEGKYRLLVENQTDLIVKLDMEGHLRFASPSYCTLFGTSEAQILGTSFLPLVHEDDRAASTQMWQTLLEPPHTGYIRQRVKTPAGWRWLAWTAKGVLGEDQQVKEVVAAGRDITELWRAEELLRLVVEATSPVTGEQFFHSLTRKLATTLGVRRVFVTQCIDYPTSRVRMLCLWFNGEFAQPREFDLSGTPCEHVIKEGKICFYPRDLGRHFPKKKEAGFESYIGIPIFDSVGGKVIGHIAVFDDKDMSDELLVDSVFRIFAARAGAELQRMQAAEALRASEEKYRLLVEHQTDLLLKADRDGKLTFVSPSYCEMFGIAESELLGTTFAPLSPTDGQESAEAWQNLRRPPHQCHIQRRMMTARGWRWIAWAAKAMLDERQDVTEVVVAGRDITEQRRAEEQARQHLNELAHVSRLSSMGEMASALAHELNQPLASALSYTQACLRIMSSSQADASELRRAMERVTQNVQRAGEIVKHLRDFVRKGEPQRTSVNVNYLVREVERLMRTETRQSSITLTLDLASDLQSIHVDNIQLQQVIFNLLRNAIDAINACGNGERQITIRTGLVDGGAVEISVSDTGVGIPDGVRDSLFDPFVTTKPDGMGMGLSISRSIVEAHGGRLWATPNPGQGVTFHILLPGETHVKSA